MRNETNNVPAPAIRVVDTTWRRAEVSPPWPVVPLTSDKCQSGGRSRSRPFAATKRREFTRNVDEAHSDGLVRTLENDMRRIGAWLAAA